MKEFSSEYANVRWIEENKVVFLEWKKEAYLDNYRQPTSFALQLLQDHPDSNLVIDARNGFEDDKRDVEWGFQYLLPEMSKTSCRCICFIMNQINAIEAEMDMWTLEFGKYFGVTRAETFEQAIYSLQHYIFTDVKYVIKAGKREEFIGRLLEEQIVERSRQEPGNIKYEISVPVDSSNEVCITELWVNKAEQKRHGQTKQYARLTELKKQYVESIEICNYQVSRC